MSFEVQAADEVPKGGAEASVTGTLDALVSANKPDVRVLERRERRGQEARAPDYGGVGHGGKFGADEGNDSVDLPALVGHVRMVDLDVNCWKLVMQGLQSGNYFVVQQLFSRDHEDLGGIVSSDGPHAAEKDSVAVDCRDKHCHVSGSVSTVFWNWAGFIEEIANDADQETKVAKREERPEGDCRINDCGIIQVRGFPPASDEALKGG